MVDHKRHTTKTKTMKTTSKQIDDIWIFMITAQFILDHADDCMISENWCSKRLKSSLKTTIDELKKITSIPFVQLSVNATPEIVEQQITGSILAEQNMRLSLRFGLLSKDEQFRFQMQYENLLNQFKLEKQ
jgi:hypothetical protein